MARRSRIDIPGQFLHVTARGVGKEDIFRTPADREEYMALLWEWSARCGISVLAYCLMTNHVHVLVENKTGKISQTMKGIHERYVQRFNRRNGRRGHLFCERFHSRVVFKSSHLIEAGRYIHMNPVYAGMVKHPEEFEHSSYRDYIGMRPRTHVDKEILMKSFEGDDGIERFRSFTEARERVDRGEEPASWEDLNGIRLF